MFTTAYNVTNSSIAISSSIFLKNVCASNFLPANILQLLVPSIFLYHVITDVHIEDLLFELWFLTTQLQ